MSNINSSNEFALVTSSFNPRNFIDPNGIFWLGYCYEHGIGVVKDKNKAFIYYQESANMNNPNGIYQVGNYYYLGIGIEMDKHKAFMHYRKSAEVGNSMGIFKTAICYKYGIGISEDRDKFNYWITKDSSYGKCVHCNEYNTKKAWCQTCDPDVTIQGWTSGNKDIDHCMKEFQLKTYEYELMIEWIPFHRLDNIKKIGVGAFSSVFSATWLDGIRKIKNIEKTDVDDDNKYFYERTREPSSTVALKTLFGSKDNPQDFLEEFENHMKCASTDRMLKMYGLTQDTEINEFMMVFQYANNGNLYKFLKTNFRYLTWQTKLKLLEDISYNLCEIHRAGYIHADLHSGNILLNKGIDENMRSYISDLGLSKKYTENNSKGDIYGVMPYIAPEVLLGKKLTQAADIYSFGVIMSEMSTGQKPFEDYEFNIDLAIKICKGLRPEFVSEAPDCYIEFAKQCMDANPRKRPNAQEVYHKLKEWNKNMESSGDGNEIKKQFLEADKIAKELPINSPKHLDIMYTSKMINTPKISTILSNSIDSIKIPDDEITGSSFVANTFTEIMSHYISVFDTMKLLVAEIYQIYENAECNKKICQIMTNRAKITEYLIGQTTRNMGKNKKEFRKKSHYLAFERFKNILSKIKYFTKNISKLKGYKIFLSTADVKNKYEQLIKEYDNCMFELYFVGDVSNMINKKEDTQKVDNDLEEVSQILKILGNTEIISQAVDLMKLQKTTSASVKKIDYVKDLEDPVFRSDKDIRDNVIRKFYKPLGVDVACKPLKIMLHQNEIKLAILAIFGKLDQSSHILRFYGLSTINNRQVMVYTWAEWGNLKEFYNRFNISWTRKIQFIKDICHGIAFLCAVNVYHRDIRCENIFIIGTTCLKAKLGNFPFASADFTSKVSEIFRGFNWTAPELMESHKKKKYTFNCEIFSFGMLIWELCYERVPYYDWELRKIADHVLSGKREKFLEKNFEDSNDKEIQLKFIKIISEAWHHSPSLRISITKLNSKLEKLAVKYPIPPDKQPFLSDKVETEEKLDENDEIIVDDFVLPIKGGIEMHQKKDYEGAWKCFKHNADLGDPIAKFWQGCYLNYGYYREKDLNHAKRLFKEAADNFHSESQCRYAVLLISDLKDADESARDKICREIVYYLELAANNPDAKNVNAMYFLGDIYINGKLKVQKDEELGLIYLRLAAESNNRNAINLLKKIGK